MLVDKNCDKLVKEESVTKNSRKVSGTKTIHGSKLPPKVKKQIKGIIIYRYKISQSYFFMHLIFDLLRQGY